MQRGRSGRDDFFGTGDPFAGFGGFGRPGSLMSSLFGGRDPFDDPFFTQPFGSFMGRNMFGPSMFGPRMFPDRGSLFGEASNSGFLEQVPQVNKQEGPVIQEVSDDDEGEEDKDDMKQSSVKHSMINKEPLIQMPDEVTKEKSRHVQYMNNFNHPKGNSCTFQSSTVTYGGLNGAYYTSSTTRKMGGDGVVFEESREADTTTGKATHRVSRGIREKGHTVTRKLKSDGSVDTLQTLHNIRQDELSDFEKAWRGNTKRHLPGWNQGLDVLDNQKFGNGSGCAQEQARGWALPSTEQPHTVSIAEGNGSGSAQEQARGWALPSTRQPHDSGSMRSQLPTCTSKAEAP